jgi:hypothetical protein
MSPKKCSAVQKLTYYVLFLVSRLRQTKFISQESKQNSDQVTQKEIEHPKKQAEKCDGYKGPTWAVKFVNLAPVLLQPQAPRRQKFGHL